jgi:hypothetical protein
MFASFWKWGAGDGGRRLQFRSQPQNVGDTASKPKQKRQAEARGRFFGAPRYPKGGGTAPTQPAGPLRVVGGSPCPWPDGIRQKVARAVARSGRDVLTDCRL